MKKVQVSFCIRQELHNVSFKITVAVPPGKTASRGEAETRDKSYISNSGLDWRGNGVCEPYLFLRRSC